MSSAAYRFHDYVLDCRARELRHRGGAVAMPARVFECLQYLIEHQDRAVGRDELALAIFARDNVSDAQLSQIVLRARRAVGDDGQEQRLIRTVPRYGFRWVAPVEASAVLAEAPAAEDGAAPDATPAPDPTPAGALPVPALAPPGQRRILAALAVLALLLTAGAWWALLQRDRPVASERSAAAAAPAGAVIVLPTEVSGPQAAAWARLGLMDFIGDRLRRNGLPVASSESVLSLLHGQQREAVLAQLRRAAGSGWIIGSTARHRARGWRVELAAEGAAGTARHAIGEHADLVQAADQASGRLLAALGRSDSGAGIDLSLAERLQRAQAAMLSNELETARRILQEAPELQRSEPQLRLRLVQVDFRAGKHAEGLAEIDRLLRTPLARSDPMFRARALLVRGGICVRLDRYAEGERAYSAAIALLDPEAQAPLLGGALNGRGVTRSALGDFSGALQDLGRARILLARSGDLLSVARVDANLGHLEEQRGRPAQSVEYLGKAAAEFRRFGAIQELVSMHAALAVTHLRLLQPEQARASIERAWALRDQVTDVTQATNIALGLAEVMIREGRFEQAHALLDRHGDGPVLPGDLHRADALRAELALRSGDAARAVAIVDQALRGWSEDAWASRLQRMQWLRQQAALQADQPLRQDLVDSGEDPVTGHLLAAIVARADGRHADAEAGYRAAVARAEQQGIPGSIAQAVLAYAPWLIERGELAEATALVGRIAPWARRDFDLALLQLRLFHALGQAESWEQALQDARRLAGERPIPGPLQRPPAARG
ncbi:winged helix-turn-helix domain-containing protein [Luteimonas sp. RD2P54]|uniref:Winged helix-turn-helix domain-containing protein n=1 Tax=Luteimonas endophytica TaxID=3042023 RepID=A0ABT6JF03_9GAMM|nr:winged helix-turn-helix domain-containing protein [Luteimonas endophytica]MDH5824758.1 winged helix-turn-helix domain-containing protein [Luteimonas endophytica]